MKKKYFVLKIYGDNYSFASFVFDTNSKDDAFKFVDLMTRNSDDDNIYQVGCWVEK